MWYDNYIEKSEIKYIRSDFCCRQQLVLAENRLMTNYDYINFIIIELDNSF
jgi:hypothetical protein